MAVCGAVSPDVVSPPVVWRLGQPPIRSHRAEARATPLGIRRLPAPRLRTIVPSIRDICANTFHHNDHIRAPKKASLMLGRRYCPNVLSSLPFAFTSRNVC